MLAHTDSDILKKDLMMLVRLFTIFRNSFRCCTVTVLLFQSDECEALRASNTALLNKIQAVRGNIIVCCRSRPPNDNELRGGGSVIVDAADDSEVLCFDG
jgi:hypothetical protein